MLAGRAWQSSDVLLWPRERVHNPMLSVARSCLRALLCACVGAGIVEMPPEVGLEAAETAHPRAQALGMLGRHALPSCSGFGGSRRGMLGRQGWFVCVPYTTPTLRVN